MQKANQQKEEINVKLAGPCCVKKYSRNWNVYHNEGISI